MTEPTYTDLMTAVSAARDTLHHTGTLRETDPAAIELIRIAYQLQLADKQLTITALQAALVDAHQQLESEQKLRETMHIAYEHDADERTNLVIRLKTTIARERNRGNCYRQRAMAINRQLRAFRKQETIPLVSGMLRIPTGNWGWWHTNIAPAPDGWED